MKKFILRILIFLLPIAVIACLGDYLLTKNIKQSRKYEFSTWEDIYNSKINSDITIYGSSRALLHIDPRIIERDLNCSSYNLGMDGQSIWLQNLRHIEYLKYNPKPKVVIYSLDEFLFNTPVGVFNSDQFLPYILWQHPEIKKQLSAFEVQPFSYLDYKIPFLRYIGSHYFQKAVSMDFIRNYYSDHFSGKKDKVKNSTPIIKKDSTEKNLRFPIINDPTTRVKGYTHHNLTWNNDLDNATHTTHHYELTIDPKAVLLFEQIIKDLQQKNIQVILVYSPEYIDGQKFVKDRYKIIDVYKNIGKKYNIPFLDYSNSFISFDKKYFYNSIHLNVKGSELFTETLVKDLTPILKEKLKN